MAFVMGQLLQQIWLECPAADHYVRGSNPRLARHFLDTKTEFKLDLCLLGSTYWSMECSLLSVTADCERGIVCRTHAICQSSKEKDLLDCLV